MKENKTNEPNLREMLGDAQRLLVSTLLDSLKKGTITHQEMTILQKELNRNGVVLQNDDADDARRVAERHAADLPEDLDPDGDSYDPAP